MATIQVQVNAQTAQAVAELQNLVGGLERLTKIGDFFKAMGQQIAAAFTVGGIVKMGRDAVNTADAMGKLAQKTGMAVENISTLIYAAKLNDVDEGELKLGIKALAEQIGAASEGSKEAIKTFDDLNVSYRNQDGSLREIGAVMMQVSDRFRDMPDGIRKTNAAVNLFGRSGQDLIPMLNAGSAGIRAMQEEARRLGLEISGQTARDANEFNDNLSRLRGTIDGFIIALTKDLLPTLINISAALISATRDTGGLQQAARFLADWLRGVVAVLLAMWTALKANGIAIGNLTAIYFTSMSDAISSLIRLFKLWFDNIRAVITLLINLGSTAGKTSEILKSFFKGDFSDAADRAKRAFQDVTNDFLATQDQIKGNFLAAIETVTGLASRTWTNVKTIGLQTIKDIGLEWEKTGKKILNLFDKAHSNDADETKHSANAPSFPFQGMSKETRSFLEEINEAYKQATSSRQRLLDEEYAANLERLQREVKDEEERYVAESQLAATYNAKRRALTEQMESAKAQIESAALEAKRAAIEQDPDLTRVQKKRELIPLLNDELGLLEKQIAFYQTLAADPAVTDEARIEAQRELLRIEGVRYEIALKLRDLQSDNFTDTLRRGINQLQDEWSNLGQNIADVTLNGIRSAIQGVSDAIMGAITGTRTWGEVFTQVARSIIASLIQVVVQWVAQMTILKLLKLLLHTEDTTQAAQSAAAWGPAAVAASIASYGAAAAIGTSAALAGMAAGAIAGAGLGSVGYSEGGYTGSGGKYEPAGIVHKGEYVFDAASVARIGLRQLEALRAGAQTMRGLHAGISSGIARPITTDGNVAQTLPGLAGVQSIPAPNVNVTSAPAKVVVLDSEEKYNRWLENNPGAHQVILNKFKANITEMGVRS